MALPIPPPRRNRDAAQTKRLKAIRHQSDGDQLVSFAEKSFWQFQEKFPRIPSTWVALLHLALCEVKMLDTHAAVDNDV